MDLRSKMVGVVRDLYVNAEPHDECISVRPLRKWSDVEVEARLWKAGGAFAQGTAHGANHQRFDDLYEFIWDFLTPHGLGAHSHPKRRLGQVATDVETNAMIVQLLQILYHLIRCGFVAIEKLRQLCKGLTIMLDGRRDTLGVSGATEMDRYVQQRVIKTDKRDGCGPAALLPSLVQGRCPDDAVPHSSSPHLLRSPLSSQMRHGADHGDEAMVLQDSWASVHCASRSTALLTTPAVRGRIPGRPLAGRQRGPAQLASPQLASPQEGRREGEMAKGDGEWLQQRRGASQRQGLERHEWRQVCGGGRLGCHLCWQPRGAA